MLRPEDYLAAPLEEFVAAISSHEATPGGGAVAALGAAMAAGLTAMAASFSEDLLEDAASIRLEAEAIGFRTEQLAARDALAYQDVLAAMGRAKEDPGRRRAVTEALEAASEIPLRVVEEAQRVNELALVLFEAGNRNLRGDAATAAYFSDAAARSAAALVRINLIEDEDARVRRAEQLTARCALPRFGSESNTG